MPCRVRYLNSAGIMKREIPGIDALAKAFPEEWLLYASLNCYPRAQSPMEIDAIVVMDDRVLLLELKDWNGNLTQRGDQWFIGRKSRGRSAVIASDEKAKKLKTVLRSEVPNLGKLWVDHRVVLTASATRDNIAESEKRFVWTLSEACSIVDPRKRTSLLGPTSNGLLKAYKFEEEFDRVTNNTKLFQCLEADWGGYRVSESNVVVHPQGVWREHRAERNGEARMKALVRVWSFDRLPPGLNCPDRRRLIAERELKLFAHLTTLNSPLIERNSIFRDIGPCPDEILTNHFQVRALPVDWTTWDRYLEKFHDDFDSTDRILLATTLLSMVSELHRSSVTHRDLGPRSVWVGSAAKMALNGFMCCQLPGEESVEDWLTQLKGYSPHLPEDDASMKGATGRQRDVFLTGLLVASALGVPSELLSNAPDLPSDFQHIQGWLEKALTSEPSKRFSDVAEMADEFAVLTESIGTSKNDQELLDRHETSSIPFASWPAQSFLAQDARRSIYVSKPLDGDDVVVKVWHGLRRNVSAATDLALIRLLESASRVLATPVQGFPHFLEVGLSSIGPYVVYQHVKGISLDNVKQLPALGALSICVKLLNSVMALHDLGCDHGDIAAKNILFDFEHQEICLMDVFDISPVGDGVIRTPALCPENWEKLSQQCLDRYAALKVVVGILETCDHPLLSVVGFEIKEELARPIVETLDISLALIRQATDSLTRPPAPTFSLTHPLTPEGSFQPDEDGYFMSRQIDRHAIVYSLIGLERELSFYEQDGVLIRNHFAKTNFDRLSYASRNSVKIDLDITVSVGVESGFLQLYEFIKSLTEPSHDRKGPVDIAPPFNVPLHWERLLDLETHDRLEIEIVDEIASMDGVSVYTFQSFGRVLDFDPESSIDVYLLPNKRIGELENGLSDSTNTIAIRRPTRRLSTGDSVFLVDRREQTSIDRRSKAVRKILDDQAAIPKLIEYFTPHAALEPTDYGVEVQDGALDIYDLNSCQKEAFRSLLRYGPVGLLQGPPGTGKTRFIASFVHWLMTEGGARRILIASQSHEAVNNAIEALVSLYKRQGGKPNLLRIGSKGITDKIRPYHSAELRDRHRVRFEAAIKRRVSILGTEKGVARQLTADVLEIDEKVGAAARLCIRLRRLAEETSETTAIERERYITELKRADAAFKASAAQVVGIDVDPTRPMEELETAYRALLLIHPASSDADLTMIRQILELSKDWLNSMGSMSRNFDEFLAKTRSIVTATCVGVGETKIRIDTSHFDWVIVDEAARCTSSELAVPIQLGRRVLLVGDHFQLMPMIKRNLVDELQEEFPNHQREDLVRSDFERAFLSPYGRKIGRRLTEQYRMHPHICNLVSNCFYEPNSVVLTTSKERRMAFEFPTDVPALLEKPICWVDTSATRNHQESQFSNSTTFHNDAEVEAIIKILETISLQASLVDNLAVGEDETPIGIICMYSGQKRRLDMACARHTWTPKFRKLIRIDTVDAYQGKENSIVIVSLIRSNRFHMPGHVRNENRCNVAMSRARDRLIIVGACTMWGSVSEGSPMRRALEYIRVNASAANIVPVETI